MSSRIKFYAEQLPAEHPPYQIDPEMYRRFDQRNNLTVGRPNWDPSIKEFTKKMGSTRIKRIQDGDPGYGVQDYSMFLAAGAVAYQYGTSINHSNRGLTGWTPQGEELKNAPRWEGNHQAAAAMVKRVARFLGADLVGIAPLNPLWIYSHSYWEDGSHKEVVFEPVDAPVETDARLVIPNAMQWVIVMGKRMDCEILDYSPTPVGCAETRVTYSRMALLVSTMAEFLRGIGYHAIPSINDLGLNIPMAIDAGLGEQGRNGKLITPDFGPSVRLCKVITDLPMARDFPISFGVKDFCQVCLKCAEDCPSNAIPKGAPTWTGPNASNSPGQFTWHLNNESCRRYWSVGSGTNCTICIRDCPFTKKPGWIHEITRTFIAKVPALNPLWRNLDGWLGYGKEKKATLFWEAEI